MTAANAVLPPIQRILHPNGATFAEPLLAVVWTVNTAFAVPSDAMTTLPGLRLHVGRLCAPWGKVVKARCHRSKGDRMTEKRSSGHIALNLRSLRLPWLPDRVRLDR